MSEKIISIDIGVYKTRICEVDYMAKNPHVYQCITFPTPEGTYEDGFIRNKEKFVEIAREKIAEAKIKTTKVVFTVTSTKIANREILIPEVKTNKIQAIIEANASDYFPVEIGEYSITYNVLERLTTENEKKLRVSVLAAPNNLIKNYYNIANLLELQVMAIDYIGNSIFQLCKQQVKTGTGVIIQVHEDTTFISILKKDVLALQRTIPYGIAPVVQAVMHSEYVTVKDEKEALQVLSSNALIDKQLHREQNEVVEESFSQDVDETSKNMAIRDITESLSPLFQNIVRVLDYYTSKHNMDKINILYLTGQGSKLIGIMELLQNETGIEVQGIESLPAVIFDKKIEMPKEDYSDYLASIGAAIHPSHFVPKDFITEEKKNYIVHIRKVVLAGSVALALILIAVSFLGLKMAQMENQKYKSQIQVLAGANEVYEAHAAATKQYEKIKGMYDRTTGPNDALNDLFAQLEAKLPVNVEIDMIGVSETEVTMNFVADSKTTAAATLAQLKTIPQLIGVSTSSITEQRDAGGEAVVNFAVTAMYQNVEGGDNNENAN